MKIAGWLKEHFEKDRRTLDFKLEDAIIDFTEQIAFLMDKENISKAELSRRLDTSNAFITKILRGDNNFTLKTMISLAQALDADFKINITPSKEEAPLMEDFEHIAGDFGAIATLSGDRNNKFCFTEDDNDDEQRAA